MNRISLGNEEFEGHNNAYVLADGDTLSLVDTGIATPSTREELKAGLAEYGATFEDVDQIVLTHWHPDHSRLAGEIQLLSGATVFAHEDDAPLISKATAEMDAYERLQSERFEHWGIPEEPLDKLDALFDAGKWTKGESVEVTPVRDGDRIEVAGRTLIARHSPGHTAGSCRFELPEKNVVFVGDVILPVYTPNVGGADVRVDRPLASYLETLRSVIEADYDRLLPGHRSPIESPNNRAATIIGHHRERTQRVIELLEKIGPADPWTISAHLFGSLEGIHIMHGPGEAYAHLDHLVHEGIVTESDGEYALSADKQAVETVLAKVFP